MNVEGSAAAERPETIVFSSFRLDLRGGQLTRAGAPIALRPKTWAVLVHLAARPGILVTKEELLDAIWPDVAVTPDTLTKSIGELRLALGDDSANPGFIATVHRRGFRFIAAPSEAAASDAAPPVWHAGDAGVRPFVGRTAEIRQLAERFSSAAAGQRQMVFVTGPAGVGKTTLVDTFLDRPALHGANPPVWIARGTGVEQYGPGEPYMPVLKAVERLAHRTDGDRLVTLLRRTAPTWLAQMPWLIADDAEALRESLQAARAERMLREFAALIEALTADLTLVLVLEDLHWSDPATVDLLTLLAERREPARLLVIGTYRPAEIAVHEHALGNAVRVMQLRRQCTELPVHELTEADVCGYLAARFPGAQLPPALARRLHAHTDGNPLFVASVVDHMLSRGWILDTAPGWSFVGNAAMLDLGLPDDARRMIETQLESLTPADRALLEAASVVGLEFAAQTVAAPLRCELEDVETRCEMLARPQRFLRFAGSGDWSDGSSALHYAFTHELFRRSVYERIPAGRRQRLHQRIGATLEAAYGERATDFASELAIHFEQGGDYARALHYLGAAAERARRRFASREAISYLEAAIDLSARVPGTAERDRRELELRLALAPTLSDLHGFASREVSSNCERAHELCREVGTPVQLFHILYALCHAYAVRVDAIRAPALTKELDDLARRLGTPEHRLLADGILARTAMLFGRFMETCRIMEGPLSEQLRGEAAAGSHGYGADPVIGTHCSYALALWFLGHTDRARSTMRASMAASTAAGIPPFTQAAALGHSIILAMLCRNPAKVRQFADQLAVFTKEYEFGYWSAMTGALAGWARVQTGEIDAGIAGLEQARAELAATGARLFSTYVLAFLSEAHLRAGDIVAGLAAADEGLQIAETTLDRSYWPELWRLKGELLLADSGTEPQTSGGVAEGIGSSWAAAEECLLRGLDLAREFEARSLELRAATSLARAWNARGRVADARRVLGTVCAWFGTDAKSPDLLDARSVLEQLSAVRPRAARASRQRTIRQP
jgi:DNA-binding winged helix-turn-helix (wHTH) protein/predicted ATPase